MGWPTWGSIKIEQKWLPTDLHQTVQQLILCRHTFGPQRVAHRCALVIHRVLTGSNSRVNLNAGMDISRTEGTSVRVGAPLSEPKHCNTLLNNIF